jgi:NhaP-type Na+/H+ or K+/H+ antiporter
MKFPEWMAKELPKARQSMLVLCSPGLIASMIWMGWACTYEFPELMWRIGFCLLAVVLVAVAPYLSAIAYLKTRHWWK